MKEKRERHAVGEESNSKTWKRQIITTTTTTGRNPHAELIGVSRPSSWMNGAYILGGNKHSYTVALRKWLGLPVSRPVTSTSGGRVHVTPTSFPLHPKRRWLPFSFLLFSCFFFFFFERRRSCCSSRPCWSRGNSRFKVFLRTYRCYCCCLWISPAAAQPVSVISRPRFSSKRWRPCISRPTTPANLLSEWNIRSQNPSVDMTCYYPPGQGEPNQLSSSFPGSRRLCRPVVASSWLPRYI